MHNPPNDPLDSLYVLGGVVIHLGIADAGHYYSLIKDRDT